MKFRLYLLGHKILLEDRKSGRVSMTFIRRDERCWFVFDALGEHNMFDGVFTNKQLYKLLRGFGLGSEAIAIAFLNTHVKE